MKPFLARKYYSNSPNEMFRPVYDMWQSQVQLFNPSVPENPVEQTNHSVLSQFDLITDIIYSTSTEVNDYPDYSTQLISKLETKNFLNCSEKFIYDKHIDEYKPILQTLNIVFYTIIIIGILFNILNLIVLLKSKLNESPYTYLTVLALSDLGALLMVGVEKVQQKFANSNSSRTFHIYFVLILINAFLSCSMYVTLALTIERFIFVHSPFKAMTICRKSIARRVCFLIFIVSVLRSFYLPFMYRPNCWQGFSQKDNKLIDILEFLISYCIPYTIIFIANISLIFSLKKQNNLMSVPLFHSSVSFNLSSSSRTNTILENSLRKIRPKLRRISTINNATDIQPIYMNEKKSKLNSRSCTSLELSDEKQKKNSKSLPHLNSVNSVNTCATNVDLTNLIDTINQKNSQCEIAKHLVESLKLKESNKTSSLYHRTTNLREMRNQKKLTTTLIIILCLLLICYLPTFLFEESLANAIFGQHDRLTEDSLKAFKIKAVGHRVSIILIYFNCMANFLIYCICNKKFKNSLKILIKKSIFARIWYYISIKCCLRKYEKESRTVVRYEIEHRNDHQAFCSYYNSYHFKYYQKNMFKNSLMDTELNNVRPKSNSNPVAYIKTNSIQNGEIHFKI